MSLEQLTREGAQVVSLCEVFLNGIKVDEVPVVDGEVRYDDSARVLRSCEVELAGPIPVGPNDPLAPIGSTLALYRGARDWTGEDILQPVGVYAFDNTGVSRESRTVRVAGYDFAQLVSDARWEDPFAIASGTNLATAISVALESRIPSALWQEPNLASTSATTPSIVWGEERENDPWADIAGLARAAGMRLVFSRTGRATLAPVPDPETAPVVHDYTVGESPLLLSTAKHLDGRPYNVVVARGEEASNAAPVQAKAEDDNPASPSYIGRYRRPYFLTSGYITSEAQALEAARGELNRRLGLGEVVTLLAVPLPTLDVAQAIQAVDPAIGVDARYLIDRMTLPLRPGRSSLETRRRLL